MDHRSRHSAGPPGRMGNQQCVDPNGRCAATIAAEEPGACAAAATIAGRVSGVAVGPFCRRAYPRSPSRSAVVLRLLIASFLIASHALRENLERMRRVRLNGLRHLLDICVRGWGMFDLPAASWTARTAPFRCRHWGLVVSWAISTKEPLSQALDRESSCFRQAGLLTRSAPQRCKPAPPIFMELRVAWVHLGSQLWGSSADGPGTTKATKKTKTKTNTRKTKSNKCNAL